MHQGYLRALLKFNDLARIVHYKQIMLANPKFPEMIWTDAKKMIAQHNKTNGYDQDQGMFHKTHRVNSDPDLQQPCMAVLHEETRHGSNQPCTWGRTRVSRVSDPRAQANPDKRHVWAETLALKPALKEDICERIIKDMCEGRTKFFVCGVFRSYLSSQ